MSKRNISIIIAIIIIAGITYGAVWYFGEKSRIILPLEKESVFLPSLNYKELAFLVPGLPEGAFVKARGTKINCVDRDVSIDDESPGSGCYLYDNPGEIFIGFIGEFKVFDNNGGEIKNIDEVMDKEQEYMASGNVMYCGGKKIEKYICGLKNTKIFVK